MSPQELANTIYLGDRACNRVILNGNPPETLSIEVDLISRIRSASGEWEFYAEEDIENGAIVFEDVEYFQFSPRGGLPGDWVQFCGMEESRALDGRPGYIFKLSLGSRSGLSLVEVSLEIKASGFYLYDPARPTLKIRE